MIGILSSFKYNDGMGPLKIGFQRGHTVKGYHEVK